MLTKINLRYKTSYITEEINQRTKFREQKLTNYVQIT